MVSADQEARQALPVGLAWPPEVGSLATRIAKEADHIRSASRDLSQTLGWCEEIGKVAPKPGSGATQQLWEALATAGAIDTGFARILEPHLDALAILHQAGPTIDVDAGEGSTWGVFAAEGLGMRVDATQSGGRWTLNGDKPWCSLAGNLSHALITAYSGKQRQLFAVNLRGGGIRVHDGPWIARGLRQVRSTPITLTNVAAVAIGEPDWYLDRPGFRWGGIGVAACWLGGAIGIARNLYSTLANSSALGRSVTDINAMHLGKVDTRLATVKLALAQAAALIDSKELDIHQLTILAQRIRAQVFWAAETVLRSAAHALGPSPLVTDEDHARQVADLDLYLRQHPAEAADTGLGRSLLADGTPPW